MNNKDKTKDELIRALLELKQSYNVIIKEEYEKGLLLIKKADERAAKSEEKFRKAFMISPDVININRFTGGLYLVINKGFTEIMGLQRRMFLGRHHLN